MSLIDNLTFKCFDSNRGDVSFKITTTTTGIFIVRVTKGYQSVMNVRIILINCNRNVNRTIVFLILIYWWVG